MFTKQKRQTVTSSMKIQKMSRIFYTYLEHSFPSRILEVVLSVLSFVLSLHLQYAYIVMLFII